MKVLVELESQDFSTCQHSNSMYVEMGILIENSRYAVQLCAGTRFSKDTGALEDPLERLPSLDSDSSQAGLRGIPRGDLSYKMLR